tara:strand:+ start:2397 stop:2618 length:222 start_codon:yes stop_codon:yes gene_type:complete
MANWALIIGDTVSEVVNQDPTGRSGSWVSCDDTVKSKDSYDPSTKTFTAKTYTEPTPDLAEDVKVKGEGYLAE